MCVRKEFLDAAVELSYSASLFLIVCFRCGRFKMVRLVASPCDARIKIKIKQAELI